LTVARNQLAGFDVKRQGLYAAPQPLSAYASQEVHVSVIRSLEMLGIGRDHLRLIQTNDRYQLEADALKTQIRADRALGIKPFCVIGTAGTPNTGAVDDLQKLSEICTQEKMWLHVDGAFGALLSICDEWAPQLKGLEAADSVAFDLHKWFHVPYGTGVLLVRDKAAHKKSFTRPASYLSRYRGGIAASHLWFNELGPETSRRFNALKIWFLLKSHGVDRYRALMRQNIEQAQRLARAVKSHPELELLAPLTMNIVCFRYLSPGLNPEELDRLNEDILIEIERKGDAVLSPTTLSGCFALRAAFTNHRTRPSDVEALVQALIRAGKRLTSKR